MTDHKPGNPHDVVTIKPPSARQVAKEIERRRARRKIFLVLLLIAAVALALAYGTCGAGWGLGGKGKGDGEGSGPGSGVGSGQGLLAEPIDAGPRRCSVFIASEGITVEGRQMTRDEAVTACKEAGAGADVIVAGDVVQKDWDELRDALSLAGVEVFTRESPKTGSGSAGSEGRAAPDPGSEGSAGSGSAAGSDLGAGSG